MVLEAGDITPPLDSMSTHLVGLGCATRERVGTPPVFFANPLTVASEHFKAGELVWNVGLIESVTAVSLLPLEQQ